MERQVYQNLLAMLAKWDPSHAVVVVPLITSSWRMTSGEIFVPCLWRHLSGHCCTQNAYDGLLT